MRNFFIVSLIAHLAFIYFFYSSEKITKAIQPSTAVEIAVVEQQRLTAPAATDLESENIVPSRFEKIQTPKNLAIAVKAPQKSPAKAAGLAAPKLIGTAKIQPFPMPVQNVSSADLGINIKYPRLSRMLSEQGRVLVLVLTDNDGHIHKMSIDSSSGFSRLDDAAMEALSNSRPPVLDKNSKIKISFLFKLK